MREIDIAYRTMFSELAQRSLDAQFEADYPIKGRFVTVPVKAKTIGISTFQRLTATRGDMSGLMPIPKSRPGSGGFAISRNMQRIVAAS